MTTVEKKSSGSRFVAYALIGIMLTAMGYGMGVWSAPVTSFGIDGSGNLAVNQVNANNVLLAGVDVSKATTEETASYVVWVDGGVYYAKNGHTGAVTSNANATTLIKGRIDTLTDGGAIFFKNGEYLIGTTILIDIDNISLIGESRNSTVFAGQNTLGSGTFVGPIMALNYTKATVIKNIHFDGSGMNPAYHVSKKAVYASNIYDFVFENNIISNTPATGLGVDFIFNSLITNNYVYGTGTAGETGGSNGLGIGTANSINPTIISENIVEDVANNGILLENQSGLAHGYSKAVVIDSNIVSRCGLATTDGGGIRVDGEQAFIISNNVLRGNQEGITVSTPEWFVNTNASKDGVISNNMIQLSTEYGIYIDKSQSKNLLITGNMITSTTVSGIYVNATEVSITGNYFVDNTDDITIAAGATPHITGNYGYWETPDFPYVRPVWVELTADVTAGSNGRVRVTPLEVEKTVNATGLTVALSIAELGKNIRLGLYADNSGTPAGGALIATTANILCNVTGVKVTSFSGGAEILKPGLYWVAIEYEGIANSMAVKGIGNIVSMLPAPYNGCYYDRGGGYGDFTDPCPAVSSSNMKPGIWLVINGIQP